MSIPRHYQSMRTVPLLDGAIPFLKAQIRYATSKHSLFLFCKENGGTSQTAMRILLGGLIPIKDGRRTHPPGPWYILKRKVGLPDAHIFIGPVILLPCRHIRSQDIDSTGQIAGAMGILVTNTAWALR